MLNGKINVKLTAKMLFKKRLGLLQAPHIILYRGFGNKNKVHVKGRVLEKKALAKPQKSSSKGSNFKHMAQRYFSDYYPQMVVEVSCGGLRQAVQTQDDGLFEAVFTFANPLQPGWISTEARLINETEITASGEALIARDEQGVGIISDIDDTVLISHTTEAMKALRLFLFHNARTRMPFEGVRAFYQALCTSKNDEPNPIFYVSSSEWNIYDLLADFFDYNQLPKGPFLLHDYRTSLLTIKLRDEERHNHKLDKIQLLLNTYPGLKFVLIGDSGQQDAELYAEAVKVNPGRIKAVFIRNVSDPLRAREVESLYMRLNATNTPMFLVDDSLEAARSAEQLGLINKNDFAAITRAMEMDRGSASGLF